MRTPLLYLLAAVGYLGFLTVVGYPIRELCSAVGRSQEGLLPSPVLGLPVVQLFAWYWLTFTGSDLDAGLPILLGAGILTSGALLVHRRRWRPTTASLLLPIFCLIGSAGLIGLNYSNVLASDALTTFTVGNNDAAGYAINAQHLLDRGDESGNLSGLDLGDTGLGQAFGAYAGASALPAVTDIEVWRLLGAFLFAAIFLCVYSTAWLLRQLARLSALKASLVATLSAGGVLFVYVGGQFFLAQLLATGLLAAIAALLIRAAEATARRPRIGLILLPLTLLVFALMATYGHMAFLATPILVAAAVLAGPGIVTRGLRVGLSTIAAFLGGALIAPQVAVQAVNTLHVLSRGDYGWVFGGFLPVELLGFMRSLTPAPSIARWAWSSVILLIFAAGVAVLWRRQPTLARFSAAAIFFTLLSYGAVYVREGGPSYVQWKWITLFDQLFVSLVLVVITAAVVTVLDRPLPRTGLHLGVSVSAAALLLYGTVIGIAGEATPDPGNHWRPAKLLAERHSGVAKHPAIRPVTAVNVESLDYWDTLWLTYFLRDKKTYLLEPNYYPMSPPVADWTVERVESHEQPIPGLRIQRQGGILLTDAFRLFSEPHGCAPSTIPDGLGSRLVVHLDANHATAGGSVSGRLEATNVGSNCWLASRRPEGGVVLGARLADEAGAIVAADYLRAPLIPDGVRPLRPGDSSAVDLAVRVPGPGRYVLKFQLVSEYVSWFGQVVDLPIEVR